MGDEEDDTSKGIPARGAMIECCIGNKVDTGLLLEERRWWLFHPVERSVAEC
jgi:hypothetical protein